MQLNSRRIALARQVLVFTVLATIVVLVASNVAGNLERKGLSLSFEFLRRPASFDIPFKRIDFTSRDTYARAAIVAILNTMLVSVLAIVTATVVGVAFGTFLLSPNPLLRRTAFGFVEAIKNTPQLSLPRSFFILWTSPRLFCEIKRPATSHWQTSRSARLR